MMLSSSAVRDSHGQHQSFYEEEKANEFEGTQSTGEEEEEEDDNQQEEYEEYDDFEGTFEEPETIEESQSYPEIESNLEQYQNSYCNSLDYHDNHHKNQPQE